MNVDVWLPPVFGRSHWCSAVSKRRQGPLFLMLAGARARRIKHVPVDGAELYANGVPQDEAQFQGCLCRLPS